MVCTRIVARDPSLRTVIDADLSNGDTLRVMTLTIFPDLSITVKTTEVAPFAPAFGENRMRPVKELIPGVTVGVVSADVEFGSPLAPVFSTPEVEVLESIVRDIGVDGVDLLPVGSVTVAETDHVPSVRVGKSHDVATPTTKEHVFVSFPFVAVIVTVSPFDPPGIENDGVTSFVMLSASDFPVSELGSRSGLTGAAGADESIDSGNVPDAGPVLPAASVIDADTVHVPSVKAGSEQLVTEPAV